ncbi:MAG TPA: Na+/H+ antiporter NhaC, partial [Alteromonas sp.]|nr:Na+/H+ antiporter NhaC [Alteromonas sp.]
ALKKFPPLPSLFAGVIVGGAFAMATQGQSLQSVFDYANNGYSIQTNISEIDNLLNRGGI